ncbi:MAG: hypothetical protein E6I95_01485 [Chloroflexi bacterium]|nr:MAG: hypothetical protein E6I95_01485 [Chloroflexota bacterium]
MEPTVYRDQRVVWSFWIAAALVAVGAVAPFITSFGANSRVGAVLIPFGIAAVALAVNARLYHHGRPLAVALYFIAGLAIVYGILLMVSVPIRLAVVGTCPPSPAQCAPGAEVAMTHGESNGFAIATFCGVLGVFIGFYGLLMLYRRRAALAKEAPQVWPAQPPAKPAAETPVEAVAAAPPAATADTSAEVKVESDDEPKELPAPLEPRELPPPA